MKSIAGFLVVSVVGSMSTDMIMNSVSEVGLLLVWGGLLLAFASGFRTRVAAVSADADKHTVGAAADLPAGQLSSVL